MQNNKYFHAVADLGGSRAEGLVARTLVIKQRTSTSLALSQEVNELICFQPGPALKVPVFVDKTCVRLKRSNQSRETWCTRTFASLLCFASHHGAAGAGQHCWSRRRECKSNHQGIAWWLHIRISSSCILMRMTVWEMYAS
eukprot:1135380-Pleurochrysis_carterae.AAC.1